MIAPAVWSRLKAGAIAAVSMCGGADGGGATVGKSRQLAAKWLNPRNPAIPRIDYAFALDQVVALQGQRPPILSAYAADLGFVCIRLPEGGNSDDTLMALLVDASAEFGDVPSEVRDAARDGKICKKDREKIVRQIDEAVASLVRMRAVAAGEQ